MTKRLQILEASLAKKQVEFDAKLQGHFDTVKLSNGQPLNDKRNGRATLNKWERQNDALRALDESIKLTQSAIEKEQSKINNVDSLILPEFIKKAIENNELTQWRNYPNRFFVVGVEKARIVLDKKKGTLAHQYVSQIPDKEQYAKFRDFFNSLRVQSVPSCSTIT